MPRGIDFLPAAQRKVPNDPTARIQFDVRRFLAEYPFDPEAAAEAVQKALLELLEQIEHYTGLDLNNLILDASKIIGLFLPSQIPGLDASKIISGQFIEEQLQPLIDAISTAFGGGAGLDFDGLNSLILSLPGAQPLTDAISNALGHPGTGHTPTDVLGYLGLIPGGNIGTPVGAHVIPSLDASKIGSGLIALVHIPTLDDLHIPTLDASKIGSGILAAVQIPGLDASKIVTGSFPQTMVNLTSIAAGLITGTLGLTNIPGLPAAQITSGSFGAGQIPALDASKITSGQFAQSMVNITSIAAGIIAGTLGTAQIPGLDASKVTSGKFAQSMLDITSIAAGIVTGTFGAGQIPSLDASKITSGQFAQSMVDITNIAAGIVSGTLAAGQIPALDGSKITTGTIADARVAGLVSIIQQLYNGTTILGTIGKANVPKTLDNTWIPNSIWPAAQIPSLDASKVTSGVFGQSMVSNLVADLSNKAQQSIVNSKALAGANLVVDPGFDNPDVWAYEKGVMDTAQKLTGTTSRRMTADGTLQSIYLTASGGPGLGGPWMVRPGAQYYFEASVFPKATNVGGGQIGVIGAAWDSTNVNPFSYILQPYLGPPPVKGSWTTYSGYITIPAGYDGFIPWLTIVNDVPVGDEFYWDRIVVKEATRVGNSPDLQAIADHVLNGLTGGAGWFGSGTNVPPDQSRGGLDHIYAEVQSHTTALQKLESDEQAIDNSGVKVNLDFSDYPDGNLPSIFTITYSGAGTSLLGVTNGQGGWRTKVNDGNRTARGAYNVAPTNSDFQVIRGTLGGLPEQGGSGGAPRIGVMGRLNSPSNPVTFVWGRGYCTGFLTYKGDMGCTVNNVETVWVSGIALDWSTDIRCVFGVGTQARRYQFFSGSKMIYDQVEVGTASQLGAGFRHFGLTAEIRTVSSGTPKIPGTLAAASISDAAPPATVGSGAAMYRTLTAHDADQTRCEHDG